MAETKAYFNNIPCALEKKVYFAVLSGVPGGSAGKESTCNEGNLGSIPGSPNYLFNFPINLKLKKKIH